MVEMNMNDELMRQLFNTARNADSLQSFERVAAELLSASIADTAGAKAVPPIFVSASKQCDMGVGCNEAGACYADAHGEPHRCDAQPPSGLTERERFIWNLGYSSGKENA